MRKDTVSKYILLLFIAYLVDFHCGITRWVWSLTFSPYIEVNPAIGKYTAMTALISLIDIAWLLGIIVPVGFYLAFLVGPMFLPRLVGNEILLTPLLIEDYRRRYFRDTNALLAQARQAIVSNPPSSLCDLVDEVEEKGDGEAVGDKQKPKTDKQPSASEIYSLRP